MHEQDRWLMRSNATRVPCAVLGTFLVALALIHIFTPAASRTTRTASRDARAAQRLRAEYGRLPLQFEANAGQTDSQVQFVSRGSGYALFLAGPDAVLSLRANPDEAPRVVRIQLQGARDGVAVAGEAPLPGRVNYLTGNDPSKWRTDVPTYGRVRYSSVYDGVDLVYYGNQRQLEYDFVVAPGADPARIAFTVNGDTRIEENGDLVVSIDGGEVSLHKPVVYQEGDRGREIVQGRYARLDRGFGFELGAYDRSRPLVIDPILTYSSLLGGSGGDFGQAIAVDASGRAFISGQTDSAAFPVVNPLPNVHVPRGLPDSDAFVARINAAGTALEYSTFLGGSSRDVALGIAVNAAGEAVVTGYTASPNFPLQGSLQPYGGGDYLTGGDAFVAKLGAAGNALVYSTYVGGSNDDYGRGVALDDDGNAYVIGATRSNNFPVVSAVQTDFGSTTTALFDAFVFKINAAGSALLYSTYLGGSDGDEGYAIAVDAAGSAYVSGDTVSTNFPVEAPFQGLKSGEQDAFVAKLDPTGSVLVYSTYLGGTAQPGGQGDASHGIAVDAFGRAYVVGDTGAGNGFPTTTACLGSCGGQSDAFVARFSADGSSLELSARFGGSAHEWTSGVALDLEGRVTIIGVTGSDNFPTVAPVQASRLGPAGYGDAFIVRFIPTEARFDFATYLGGVSVDSGRGIAVDALGSIYGIAWAGAVDFPTVAPPIQPGVLTSNGSVAVFKITMDTGAPLVTVQRPNASAERVYTGTPFYIEWAAADDGILSGFDVEFSTNDGLNYAPVPGCTGLARSARSCTWASPGPVTTKGRIRVKATDATGKFSADISDARFSILTGSAAITVTSPNTALTFVAGATHQIRWSHNLGSSSWVRLDVSRDGGTTWELLQASFKNTASSSSTFNWAVAGPNTSQGRVRVVWLNGPVADSSDANFSIATATLGMTKPAAGTNWGWDTTQQVLWTTNLGSSEFVNVRLSLDGGATFPILLASNIQASKKKVNVVAPVTAASEDLARIKVEWVGHESTFAVSPANFRIAMPFVTVGKPNGPADVWTVGTAPTTTWSNNLGTLENVRLELSLDGGSTYPIVMLPSTPSDGKQTVTVLPGWVTPNARVRVVWVKNPSWFDVSDGSFRIQ